MGTNRANPAAMILSATMMLRHLGYVDKKIMHHLALLLICLCSLDPIANSIASATFSVIDEAKVRTADMGGACLHFCYLYMRLTCVLPGSATTSEYTSAIVKNLS